MMQMLQMMLQNKIQQIPKGMMKQMEQQLKRTNPQAFQKYQMARKNNNPQELLNETINEFSSEQKQQWDNMMQQFGINTK